MTAGDYRTLAAALSGARETTGADQGTMLMVVERIAKALSADNERFDFATFYGAVGYATDAIASDSFGPEGAGFGVVTHYPLPKEAS